MIYKTTSVKNIISKVRRDLKTDDMEWAGDAIEWIGEVIEDLGTYTALEKVAKDLTICAHKALIPCGVAAIHAVEYDGNRLSFGGDQTGYSLVKEARTTNLSPTDEYYQVNPNYIITSFQEGTIRLHFSQYPLDEVGLPLIPDQFDYRESCLWYILGRMIMGGYQHPVFSYDYCMQNYEYHAKKARNRAKTPNIDQMETFRRTWVRILPIDMNVGNFFMGSESQEQILR